MRTVLVAFVVGVSLLVAIQPAAAITPPPPPTTTIDLEFILGTGVLHPPAGSFMVNALDFHLTIGTQVDQSTQSGSLTLGTEAPEACTIVAITNNCTSATITCDTSGPHALTAGTQFVTGGFLDGVEVKVGFITMTCQHKVLPPAFRSR